MKTNRLLARELWSLVRLGGPSASADGSVVVVPETTYDLDTNEGTTRLVRIVDGEPRPLTYGASATAPRVAPDGRAVAFLRSVDGKPQLHVLPLEGGEARVLTDFPLGVVASAWRPGGGWVVVTSLSRRAPTLEGTRAVLEEETHVTARTTEARVYRHWDGWLTDGRSHHVFVISPEGEARHVSRGLDALLCFAPSDPFAQLDVSPDGAHAVVSAAVHEDDARPRFALYLLDLVGDAEVRPLTAAHPAGDVAPRFVDDDRVLFGARRDAEAAWIPTQTNRFRCAIAHAAVTNLGGMMATDSTWGLARGYGADPLRDPERVNRWNPANHYATHETPTLVIHGEQDFRVPVSQGLELYGALKSKGVEARLVYYPDENHWVLSPANSIHWYGEIHAWLERFLGSPSGVDAGPLNR